MIIDKLIGEITEVDGQAARLLWNILKDLGHALYSTKFMLGAGETDKRILAKILGHVWDAPNDVMTFVLTVDIVSKMNKAKGANDFITRENLDSVQAEEHHHPQEVGAQCHLFLV